MIKVGEMTGKGWLRLDNIGPSFVFVHSCGFCGQKDFETSISSSPIEPDYVPSHADPFDCIIHMRSEIELIKGYI